MSVQSDLNNEQLTGQIRTIIEKHYDLGPLTRIKEIFGGYCNRSYAVWMGADRPKKYFMREYNPHITEPEIRFEHALLNHLRSNGFEIASGVFACRDGATFVRTAVQGQKPTYWAIFDFLEGEDPYTWLETDLTDAEFASAAEVLARMHHAGRDFVKPAGTDRAQPCIAEFLPTFRETFGRYAQQADSRRCDRLFLENLAPVLAAVEGFTAATASFTGMPQVPVHCDYHPGNLKYKNEKGVGVFDFDWSKIDYRVFDLALGLVYFTSRWTGDAAGSLRLDKFELFLKTYNDACSWLEGLPPLTAQEQTHLPLMLAAGNLFVLNWDLMDFYETESPDDDEYYTYIEHNVLLMHWITAHGAEIRKVVDRVCR